MEEAPTTSEEVHLPIFVPPEEWEKKLTQEGIQEKRDYITKMNSAHCGKYSIQKFSELTKGMKKLNVQDLDFKSVRTKIEDGGNVVIRYLLNNPASIHYFVVQFCNRKCYLYQEYAGAYLSEDWNGEISRFANLDEKIRDRFSVISDSKIFEMFVPKPEMNVKEDFTGVTAIWPQYDGESKEDHVRRPLRDKHFGEGVSLEILQIGYAPPPPPL